MSRSIALLLAFLVMSFSFSLTYFGPGTALNCSASPLFINTPGYYLWNQTGATTMSGPAHPCITVNASDVVLNCSAAGGVKGRATVAVAQGLKNVTITKCDATSFYASYAGFYAYNVANLTLDNNSFPTDTDGQCRIGGSAVSLRDCESPVIINNLLWIPVMRSIADSLSTQNANMAYTGTANTFMNCAGITLNNSHNAFLSGNSGMQYSMGIALGHSSTLPQPFYLNVSNISIYAPGIALYNSDNVSVGDNPFQSAVDIRMAQMGDLLTLNFKNNTVVTGIFAENCHNLLTDNMPSSNVRSIYGGPTSNTNNFLSNRLGGVIVGAGPGILNFTNNSIHTANFAVSGVCPSCTATFTGNRFYNNVFIYPQSTGDMSLSGNYFSDCPFSASSASNIINATGNAFDHAGLVGLFSTVGNVSYASNNFSGSNFFGSNAFFAQAYDSAAVSGSIFTSAGEMYIISDIGNTSFSGNNVSNSSFVSLSAGFPSASISNITISGNEISGNSVFGLGANATGSITASGNTAHDNQGYGMKVVANEVALDNNRIYQQDDYLRLIAYNSLAATDLWLGHDLTYGINYPSLSRPGADIDAYRDVILIGEDFASLDAGSPAVADLNARADITTRVDNCTKVGFYRDTVDALPQSAAEIIANGALFSSSRSSCAGTAATFRVNGFSGYTALAGAAEEQVEEGGLSTMEISVSTGPEVGGGVTLTVTSNGEPISGAEIVVSVRVGDTYKYYYITTDSNGQASFTPEYPGTYKAVAEKPGYVDTEVLFEVAPECATDEDCPEGYACVDGKCVLRQCIPACTEGYSCVNGQCICNYDCCRDSDCPRGYSCEDGKCTKPPEEVPRCTKDSDCAAGYVCASGACIEKPEVPEVKPPEVPPPVVPPLVSVEVPSVEQPKQPEAAAMSTQQQVVIGLLFLVLLAAVIFYLYKRKAKKRKAKEVE